MISSRSVAGGVSLSVSKSKTGLQQFDILLPVSSR